MAGRQIPRCNAPADNPEQYYQRDVAVPLINRIKAELDEQSCNFPVMSFRVKSLLSCSFFRLTSPSARSFLWSTEVKALLSFIQICLCKEASSVSYRQCCVTLGPVICQTLMRSSTPTKMISRCRNFFVKNFLDSISGGK